MKRPVETMLTEYIKAPVAVAASSTRFNAGTTYIEGPQMRRRRYLISVGASYASYGTWRCNVVRTLVSSIAIML